MLNRCSGLWQLLYIILDINLLWKRLQRHALFVQVVSDATGGSSGGQAVEGGLDKGAVMDSEKLAAVSDMLASTLGSGRM